MAAASAAASAADTEAAAAMADTEVAAAMAAPVPDALEEEAVIERFKD